MNPVNRVRASLDKISGKAAPPELEPLTGAPVTSLTITVTGTEPPPGKPDSVAIRVQVVGLPVDALFISQDMEVFRTIAAQLLGAVAYVEANR